MGNPGTKKAACKRGHINPARSKHGACLQCGVEYRKENYLKDRARIIARSLRYAKENPEERRDQQRASRLKVPVAAVRAVISRASGACEACHKAVTHASLCIDHCHATGTIRGVLCRFCNALEGMLNKQAGRVQMIQEYINKFTQTPITGVI